jgi:hypothetical protein
MPPVALMYKSERMRRMFVENVQLRTVKLKGKVVPVHAMKPHGGVKVGLHSFLTLTSAPDAVSVLLDAPTSLPPLKEPQPFPIK